MYYYLHFFIQEKVERNVTQKVERDFSSVCYCGRSWRAYVRLKGLRRARTKRTGIDRRMRNVDVQVVSTTPTSFPVDHSLVANCVRIADLSGTPAIYSLTESSSAILLHCAPLTRGAAVPWTTADDLALFRSTPFDSPVGLDVDPAGCEPLLLALRGGAIVSIESESGAAELVGEVVDDDIAENLSGILALSRSPDGALVAIVSPGKIIVMSTHDWAHVGEVVSPTVAVEADVSWRIDGAAFVVSTLDASGAMHGRVVDRDVTSHVRLDYEYDLATPTSTGSQLGCVVSWQPRVGGLIAVAGPGRHISFFERNGLRHLRSDFELGTSSRCSSDSSLFEARDGGTPMRIAWSSDGRMLAIVSGVALGTCRTVDVYVRNNYKWDQKSCLPALSTSFVANVVWDVEEPNVLHVVSTSASVTSFTLRYSYFGSTCGGLSHAPGSVAVAAVVDGASARVTNFSAAIIPPPMSHRNIEAGAPISAVCFTRDGAKIGFLLVDNRFQVDPVPSMRKEDVGVQQSVAWRLDMPTGSVGADAILRQPVMLHDDLVALVAGSGVCGASDCVLLFSLKAGASDAQLISQCHVPDGRVMNVVTQRGVDANGVPQILHLSMSSGNVIRIYVTESRSLSIVDLVPCSAASRAVSAVVASCESARVSDVGSSSSCLLMFVQDASGRLEVVTVDSREPRAHVISLESTSFCLSGGFLAYTTRSHVMHCVPVDSSTATSTSLGPSIVSQLLGTRGQDLQRVTAGQVTSDSAALRPGTKSCFVRPIDRGSRIVTALPNDVRIVLQAPRGNLETIAPRPLVIERVCRLARAKEYGAAFRLSRQQRVDMNVMVDADQDDFMLNVSRLVEQVPIPSHLSVFLTYLQGPDERVNAICDAVVNAIDAKNVECGVHFTNTLLTALVRRKPADYVSALKRVQTSYVQSDAEGAIALDFLLVLAKDEEMLYGEALGTYDLGMALMVAKASQLDPADYLSELRLFKRMDESFRRHAIDLKLERYESSLRNLFACGRKEREACVSFAREHALYTVALPLFASVSETEPDSSTAMTQLRTDYASYLLRKARFEDAAIVSATNGDFRTSAVAYRDAGLWQQSLDAFARVATDDNAVREFSQTVADQLSENGRAVDSAHVKWTMLQDVDGALDTLLGAHEWAIALALVSSLSLHLQQNLRRRVANDMKDAAVEQVSDLRASTAKMTERTTRLRAVRETKERMRHAVGITGGATGAAGEDDANSDAFSASTEASGSSDSGVSIAPSDMTFVSSTSSVQSRTSLYHSVGRGTGRGGRGSGAVRGGNERVLSVSAQRRAAGRQARKRVRTGHPKEESALEETLRRLVPGVFQRQRVGALVRALAGEGLVGEAATLHDAMVAALDACSALPVDVAADVAVVEAVGDNSWQLPLLLALRSD
jgi:elongator complex protein 1